MTFAFASFTLGAALLYSAFVDQTLVDLIMGRKGTSIASQGESHPASAANAAGGGGNGNSGESLVSVQGSVKGHPELKPGISAVAATVLKQFPGLTITSTTSGTHVKGSYHYKGRAVDISGGDNEMLEAAAWIKKHLTHKLVEGIHNPNLSVKDHIPVPSSVFSEVWAAHKDHIHLAV